MKTPVPIRPKYVGIPPFDMVLSLIILAAELESLNMNGRHKIKNTIAYSADIASRDSHISRHSFDPGLSVSRPVFRFASPTPRAGPDKTEPKYSTRGSHTLWKLARKHFREKVQVCPFLSKKSGYKFSHDDKRTYFYCTGSFGPVCCCATPT